MSEEIDVLREELKAIRETLGRAFPAPPTATIARDEFEALPPAERMAAIKAGRKVVDPVVFNPEEAAHRAIRAAYSGNLEAARAAAPTRPERYAAFKLNETKARELWPDTALEWDRTKALLG